MAAHSLPEINLDESTTLGALSCANWAPKYHRNSAKDFGDSMKHNVMLTIASLLSILFMTFHLTDDIVRGMEPGTLSDLIAVPILVVWL